LVAEWKNNRLSSEGLDFRFKGLLRSLDRTGCRRHAAKDRRPPLSYPAIGQLAWHPDGKMIVVTGATAEAQSRLYEHWVLENFLPNPKTSQ